MLPGHKGKAERRGHAAPGRARSQRRRPEAAAASRAAGRGQRDQDLSGPRRLREPDAGDAPAPTRHRRKRASTSRALDVREVAKVILGDYLKESYTVHPAVAGTVTFRTDQADPAQGAAAHARDAAAPEQRRGGDRGGHLQDPADRHGARLGIAARWAGRCSRSRRDSPSCVVPLKFVGAREMARMLEPFAADNTIRVDEVRNMLILAGQPARDEAPDRHHRAVRRRLARRLFGRPLPDQERRREVDRGRHGQALRPRGAEPARGRRARDSDRAPERAPGGDDAAEVPGPGAGRGSSASTRWAAPRAARASSSTT